MLPVSIPSAILFSSDDSPQGVEPARWALNSKFPFDSQLMLQQARRRVRQRLHKKLGSMLPAEDPWPTLRDPEVG